MLDIITEHQVMSKTHILSSDNKGMVYGLPNTSDALKSAFIDTIVLVRPFVLTQDKQLVIGVL